MPHIDLKALIFMILLAAAGLGSITWFGGRSFFTLLDQEERSPGIWFYIFFTGALTLASFGFLIAGAIFMVSLFL